MSMSDWNDKAGGGCMYLTVDQVYQGLKSLKIWHDYGLAEVKILNMSETDLPVFLVVDYWSYFNKVHGAECDLGIYFRYQDLDNFFLVQFHLATDTDKVEVRFAKKELGSLDWGTIHNLGAGLRNSWIHWKIKFCQIGSVVHCEIYKAGVLVKVFQRAALWEAGGAMGFGAQSWYGHGGDLNSYTCLDETRIYY